MTRTFFVSVIFIILNIAAVHAVFAQEHPEIEKPDVAVDTINNRYAVVYYKESSFYLQIRNLDGSLYVDELLLSSDSNKWYEPAIAFDPEEQTYLAVWADDRNAISSANVNSDIYASIISADGNLVKAEFPICNNTDIQNNPDIAYDSVNKKFLVAWHDNRSGFANNRIVGQFVNGKGELLDAASDVNVQISFGPGFDHFNPALSFDENNQQFLIVWGETSANHDLHGQLLNSDGTLSGSPIIVSNSGRTQEFPQVAFSKEANNFLVTWLDNRHATRSFGYDNYIYGRIVDSAGVPVGEDFMISKDNGDNREQRLVYSSKIKSYVVGWNDRIDYTHDDYDTAPTGYDIFYQTVSSAGVVSSDDPKNAFEYSPTRNGNHTITSTYLFPQLAVNPECGNVLLAAVETINDRESYIDDGGTYISNDTDKDTIGQNFLAGSCDATTSSTSTDSNESSGLALYHELFLLAALLLLREFYARRRLR